MRIITFRPLAVTGLLDWPDKATATLVRRPVFLENRPKSKSTWLLALAVACFVAAESSSPVALASVVGVGGGHVTDGLFTTPSEWTGPHVSLTQFNVVGNTGGADLYVDTSPANLYLMYDAHNTANLGLNRMNSFFDIFFQVAPEHTDYGVHIISQTGAMSVFEKQTGTPSPLTPDGSLDFTSPVWIPLTQADLNAAQFQAAVAQDPSDNHLRAEFQLTLRTSQNPTGLYSPDPAFWSASVGQTSHALAGGAIADPPISSAIFQLNSDGTTTVTPQIGPAGGPVQQPQDVPEPSSLTIAAVLGLIACGSAARRRRRQ